MRSLGRALVLVALCVTVPAKKDEKDVWVPKVDKSKIQASQMSSGELSLRLLDPKAPTFVMFMTPWCDECEDLSGTWDDLTEAHDYFFNHRFVKTDCSGDGKEACAIHGIRSFPTIMRFPGPELYGGPTSPPEALKSWVLEASPELKTPRNERHVAPVDGCVAWRATSDCDPDGPRNPDRDLSCLQSVPPKRSGFCDCGGGETKKHSECGDSWRKPFSCIEECSPVQNCISWRQTTGCRSSGHRDTRRDRECRVVIDSGDSGYCECTNSLRAAEVNCSHTPFTCEDECKKAIEEKARKEQEDRARTAKRKAERQKR